MRAYSFTPVISNHYGNIAVMVAVLLPMLIAVLSLVLDGGYLYTVKNKYQNGVDAAALAGAAHFADGNDSQGRPLSLDIAKTVAAENGLSSDSLTVKIGYYDKTAYTFKADTDYSTDWNEAVSTQDDPVYNNSIMVSAREDKATFLGGLFGQESATIYVKAVAYGERYTFVATGKNAGSSGMDLATGWATGYNQYKNCIFRSNGPVEFKGKDYETFENSRVDILAGETVTGADGKVETSEFSDTLEDEDIDWEDLRAQAEDNGVVYTHGDLESWPDDWQTDSYGNHYKRRESGTSVYYDFVPAGRDDDAPGNSSYQGDHEGRTYFFEIPDELPENISAYYLHIQNFCDDCLPKNRTCWNFTIAARCEFHSQVVSSKIRSITLGNLSEFGEEGIVYIYCNNASKKKGWWCNSSMASNIVLQPKGVIFYSENDFLMQTQTYSGDYERQFFLRCYARKIKMWNYPNNYGNIVYDGAFGPFDEVRLGKFSE